MITTLALLVAAGPWDVCFPVEGLNDKNSPDFTERILAHFRKLKDDAGREMELRVRTSGDIATITWNCPVQRVSLAEIRKALDGSAFSVDLETWRVFGRVAFTFTSDKELDGDRMKEIRETFKDIGTGTESVEVVAVEGTQYRLSIQFGRDQSAPAKKIALVLANLGFKDPVLVWEKGNREECGARRAPKKE